MAAKKPATECAERCFMSASRGDPNYSPVTCRIYFRIVKKRRLCLEQLSPKLMRIMSPRLSDASSFQYR